MRMNHKFQRRWVRLASALMMLATLVSPMGVGNGAPVQAQPATLAGFGHIRPTSDLQGPELATGALKGDVAGDDLRVYVYATPPTPRDIPDNYRPPAQVPVGVGEVTGTSFRVIADPSVDLTKFINESGRVELEAVASSSDHFGMMVFDRQLDTQGLIVEPEVSAPECVASESGKLSTMNKSGTLTLDVSVPARKGSSVTTEIAGITSGDDCRYSYFNRRALIGATYHRKNGVPLTLTYDQGSETELDTGFSVNGGRWQIGATVTKKVTTGYGTQWRSVGTADRFHYSVYRVRYRICGYTCVAPGPNNCYWKHRGYTPVTHLGGNPSGQVRFGLHLLRRNCTPFYPAGSGPEYKATRSTATRFRAGIVLGPINLSTQSGYSRANGVYGDVQMARLICGWTGPPTSPGLVTVGYRS